MLLTKPICCYLNLYAANALLAHTSTSGFWVLQQTQQSNEGALPPSDEQQQQQQQAVPSGRCVLGMSLSRPHVLSRFRIFVSAGYGAQV
jgi:hypothetical protein